MSQSELEWSLMPAGDADAALFRELVDERSSLPKTLPAAVRNPLLETQWKAWNAGVVSQNGAESLRIVVGTRAAGMLVVSRQASETRLLDFALLSEFRNRGIGTAILRSFQESATVPVCLSVRQGNPAERLYLRLGFRRVAATEVDIQMRWDPEKR